MSEWLDVAEFHLKLGIPIRFTPTIPPEPERTLRLDLLTEEYDEFCNAHDKDDLIEIADALADMLAVIYGTALSYGLPMGAVWREVHRSNMSKGGGEARADGKILKGPNYTPPDIQAVLAAEQDGPVTPR